MKQTPSGSSNHVTKTPFSSGKYQSERDTNVYCLVLRRRLVHRPCLMALTIYTQIGVLSKEHTLWVDKYSPKLFAELLSDDIIIIMLTLQEI